MLHVERMRDNLKCHFLPKFLSHSHHIDQGTASLYVVFILSDEFQTRITCEGDEMLLVCGKGKRLAIHSAMFGRNGQGNLECPFTDFVLDGGEWKQSVWHSNSNILLVWPCKTWVWSTTDTKRHNKTEPSFFKQGMSPWWPLLGLINWYWPT